jgi:hypothetical protein
VRALPVHPVIKNIDGGGSGAFSGVHRRSGDSRACGAAGPVPFVFSLNFTGPAGAAAPLLAANRADGELLALLNPRRPRMAPDPARQPLHTPTIDLPTSGSAQFRPGSLESRGEWA